jgi:DNA-binding SARP family transcriptional activator
VVGGSIGDQPLRFEILGALRVMKGGRELSLGSGKQRAVLAVLLLDANRSVPTSQIVDAVWGDDPPANGANVVQKYVAGLRRVLEPDRSPRAPGELIALTSAGYQLRVGQGCLDAGDFRRGVRRAASSRVGGHLREAAAELRTALGLWRGDPLAGITSAYLDAARERLAEDRGAALEAWAEIELELGHHGELLPETVRLVAEYPLRERLRYVQMLALYRCGRQAEALAAFRDARRYLSEEFGVEPGSALQTLHTRILNSDPGLNAAPAGQPAQPTPATSRPHGQPSRTPSPASGNGYAPASGYPPDAYPTDAYPSESFPAADHEVPGVWPAGPYQNPSDHAAATGWQLRTQRHRTIRRWIDATGGVLVPLASFGLLTWVVIAYHAARRRSVVLWLASAGYGFAVAVFFVLVIRYGDNMTPIVDGVSVAAFLVATVGGAVHGGLIVVAPPKSQPPSGKDLEQRVRRQLAREVAQRDPEIARRLGIGRPDQPGALDTGGLVDVNAASEQMLARLPGIGRTNAHWIVARREANGGFAAPREVLRALPLPTKEARALRDVMIALPIVTDASESRTG